MDYLNQLNYMFETLKMVEKGVDKAINEENPNIDLEVKDLEEKEAGIITEL